MIRKIAVAGLLVLVCACKTPKKITEHRLLNDQTFLLSEISEDPDYGLTPEKPVEVGGVKEKEGPLNERRFLNALAGPEGQQISYYRAGSCCAVKSKNGFMGMAMLDNYRVSWEGASDTVSIYINMYDRGVLKAPSGFTIKK
ncbi:2-dehydro-3-deoxyphosphooctonate aldolase [Sinomicrobium oceani]|uniref:2-dehydro-3-deoxyphosphooctonate aldolase n=1 Tax=Sinomicrobium oceani TaxID=1150368 RepID=UPI00227AC8E2|nr:2-dehydro-3-deoxyphosphooctonate aldolase [Sinomicrobium oceani]